MATDADRDIVDERGVTLTAAGRRKARRKLDEAAAKHNPEYWERLRKRLNLPPKTA